MLVVAMCFDKSESLDLRKKTRADHLNWIRESGVDITFAGPVLSDDGETPMGSLIITEFADLAAARAFFAEDPYKKAGLFERVIVQPARKVLPET